MNITQEPSQLRYFDDDFKSHYSGDRYNYEGNAIVTHSEMGSGVYEEYKKDKPKIEDENNEDLFQINTGPIAWFFYLAIALAVIYLVYILFNEGGSSLFRSKRNTSINTYEDITAENIENADILTLINNAEKEANYRLAIRYYYLLVLKTLSLNKHIKFEDDKTNTEYLNELSNKPFSKAFGYISYLYNYIWYGEFHVDIDKYNKAKSHFTTFLKQVQS